MRISDHSRVCQDGYFAYVTRYEMDLWKLKLDTGLGGKGLALKHVTLEDKAQGVWSEQRPLLPLTLKLKEYGVSRALCA